MTRIAKTNRWLQIRAITAILLEKGDFQNVHTDVRIFTFVLKILIKNYHQNSGMEWNGVE